MATLAHIASKSTVFMTEKITNCLTQDKCTRFESMEAKGKEIRITHYDSNKGELDP